MYVRITSTPNNTCPESSGTLVSRHSCGADIWPVIQKLSPDIVFFDLAVPRENDQDLEKFLNNCQQPLELWYNSSYDPNSQLAVRTSNNYFIVNKRGKASAVQTPKKRPAGLDLLFVHSLEDSGVELLRYKDIVMAFSSDKQTFIRTQLSTYRYKGTLSQLYSRLSPYGFFRCSRSTICNTRMIRDLKPWSNMRILLVMNDYTRAQITISRNYMKEFRKLVGM